ncbi:hypothetical protein EJB05_09431, partial [Eragrostis curvula]
MPTSVKIIEEARVTVPATAALPPEPLLLSAMEAEWLAHPLMQCLLIFVSGGGDRSIIPPSSPSAVAALRASLAGTVSRFPTLGGRIVHLPATGDAAIDCGAHDGGGVRFVVADQSDGADARRLAGDADHDSEAFRRLVPALDAGRLPAETTAVMVTRLRGGVALGVAMHHAVVDGRSFWRFVQAGNATRRRRRRTTVRRSSSPAAKSSPGACFGSTRPICPLAGMNHGYQINLARLSVQQLQRLKQRIAERSPRRAAAPSSFVAVVALAWVSFVRAKHPDVIAPSDEVTLFFFADCRTCVDPPPGDSYFGTCITGCLARATARDLLAEDDDDSVAHAAAAVAEEVRRAAAEPLALWDFRGLEGRVDVNRHVNMTGSMRFPAYEVTDFGWGPSGRTELVSMNQDGQVVLLAGKGGDASVQVSVSLNPAHMEAFKSYFMSYLADLCSIHSK